MKYETLIKIIKDPLILIGIFNGKGWLKGVSDENYLKWKFKRMHGKELNINNPKTYNEKLQWLKLYDRNPEYTRLVDKYEVRQFVKKTIGEEYLIPLYGTWNDFDDIDFSKLPNQFVLKTTNDSGGVVICKDKKNFNKKKARTKIVKSMKTNYYYSGREWPYKNVKARIICEKLLIQNDGAELRDYRIFCFNGEPKLITVDFSITNKKKTRRNLYDLNWKLLNSEITYPRELKIKVDKPEDLENMIELSKRLSSLIPHARVDFYYIDGKIFFGEITFYHQSGWGIIKPAEFEMTMGDWIKLPKVSK